MYVAERDGRPIDMHTDLQLSGSGAGKRFFCAFETVHKMCTAGRVFVSTAGWDVE
jgi:hypothetical protein